MSARQARANLLLRKAGIKGLPVAKNVRRYVKRMIGRGKETQAYDGVVNISVSTAGAISKMSTIAQGDDINMRQGDVIFPISQAIRFSLETSTVATGAQTAMNNSIVRVIMFQDRHGDSTPTVAGTSNTSVLAVASIQGNYNLDTMDRYKILYDKLFDLAQNLFINTGQANAVFPVANSNTAGTVLKKIKRRVNRRMEFADTTGTLPAKGQTYLLTIAHALGTSQVITLSGYSRLLYKD